MRQLRKAKTFHRKHLIFEEIMEIDDEIKATKTIVGTLRKLTPAGRTRTVAFVQSWLDEQDAARPTTAVPPEPKA